MKHPRCWRRSRTRSARRYGRRPAGANHDGTPTNPLTYTASGLTMTYNGTATGFDLFLDSGTSSGNGVPARVSYDLTGDGTDDRVETPSSRRPAVPATRTRRSRPSAATRQSSTVTEPTSDTGGGQDLGSLAGCDWPRYDSVDFGSTPASQFVPQVASGAAGGVSGLVRRRRHELHLHRQTYR